MSFKLIALFLLLIIQGVSAQPPVELISNKEQVILSNEFIKATINKKTATITSLKYKGLEMMGKAHAHWNIVGNDDDNVLKKFPQKVIYSVKTDPAKNQGERAEVSFNFLYEGDTETLPFDIDLRFSLGKSDQGIYLSGLWNHRDGYPKFDIGQGRMILVLNPGIFDFYTVDANRRQLMATAEDVKNGIRMNVKEANLLTTGIRKGEVEHKYDYSAILAQTLAWGWTSTTKHVGAWMINPSFEYINGGPTQIGNTGHVETILMNHWQDGHYGGKSLTFKKNEEWKKFVGPFYIYFNSGDSNDDLWKDALVEAGKQRSLWPFSWLSDKEYPKASNRGILSGQIAVTDTQEPNPNYSNMWVGLAATGDSASVEGNKEINWQYEGKNYQFWVKADSQGNFKIPNIREGKYTLYVFADGILGEYKKPNITVTAGGNLNLGTLGFTPLRYGKTIWEIGIPDRSAAEFRHGDHYWKWGLYMLYPTEFPNDVNYTIGTSDWSKDWNYCQPGVIAADYKVIRGTTWKINFDIAETVRGTGTLRVGICGSRNGETVQVALNGKPIGKLGPLPEMGVMHRDGIRGKQEDISIPFDAALLEKGTNRLTLSLTPKTWAFGVLYDYLRLELDESK